MPEIEKGHTITPTRAMKERGEAMASSFEHYCRERWQFARNYANKLIASSQVIENLNKGTIVPKTESQARPLTKEVMALTPLSTTAGRNGSLADQEHISLLIQPKS